MNIDDCLCCGFYSGRERRLTCLSAVMLYEITASYYTIIIQFKVALITQFSCSMHISSGLSKSEVIQGTMFLSTFEKTDRAVVFACCGFNTFIASTILPWIRDQLLQLSVDF